METKNGINTCYAKSRQHWRKWLDKNHLTEKSVWLIIYKKESGIAGVDYPAAVEEALCFGWIDSKANKRDDQSFYLYFAKRKPASKWSKVNKGRVALLIKSGLMSKAGLESIKIAKQLGTWSALNDVDAGKIPDDLQQLFDKNKIAYDHWQAFSKSSRRGILEWILNAKRPETRAKRIALTVELAGKNKRANFPD